MGATGERTLARAPAAAHDAPSDSGIETADDPHDARPWPQLGPLMLMLRLPALGPEPLMLMGARVGFARHG